MAWIHRGGQVTLVPPNTKHRVEYWVNEEKKKVIYTWYNSSGGTARIVEWDYSNRLEKSDSALNRLRDVVGADRKIKSYAGLSVGEVKHRIDTRDVSPGENIFDVALNQTYSMYPNLPRK
jgi:hypothetical protein